MLQALFFVVDLRQCLALRQRKHGTIFTALTRGVQVAVFLLCGIGDRLTFRPSDRDVGSCLHQQGDNLRMPIFDCQE